MSTSCPSHPTPQDTNLDCCTAQELEPFITDEKYPQALRDYARERKFALLSRELGNEAQALVHEANCHGLFNQIPEAFQW